MSTSLKITPPDALQFSLFEGMPVDSAKPFLKTARESGRRFVCGDPKSIFLGTLPLEEHLKQSGQVEAFTVAKLLDQQDWSIFERRYAPTGRAPYAPRLMLGLILYGVMQGVHSLRDLERLARLDLGCMWVTGGIAPDHTNIGRFIGMHEESLTNGFFESLTSSILKATGSDSSRVAGDGTVIEAACSHYRRLKGEALKERDEVARRKLAANPDDQAAQEKLRLSTRRLEIYDERKKARERSGRATDTLSVSPTEPEAMVQPLKRGRGNAPSYKPSVLANEDRIVTAMAVHPSMETNLVGDMLDQNKRVTGASAQEVLLDAGYFDDKVIAATLERDVSLLCPEGQAPGMPKQTAEFHKNQFQYDPTKNQYRCPQGQILILLKHHKASATKRAIDEYGTTACGSCSRRADCTKDEARKVRRHPEEAMRDALRQVMEHPQARAIFSRRKAMVEPVFSHLREQQGLSRFRRKGLERVKREFAIHIMAYNLSRAVALLRALLPKFSTVHATIETIRAAFVAIWSEFAPHFDTDERYSLALVNYSR